MKYEIKFNCDSSTAILGLAPALVEAFMNHGYYPEFKLSKKEGSLICITDKPFDEKAINFLEKKVVYITNIQELVEDCCN